jgi:GntR family transcriptional regulator
MILDIRPDSPIPIYEQIVAQITFAVASGVLDAGAMIPSVRELAQRIVVNPNTVARAYQELERRGVLESRRGCGMAVTGQAPAACRAERQAIIRARIRAALHEAVSSALAPDEVRRLVEEELTRVNGHKRTREKPIGS